MENSRYWQTEMVFAIAAGQFPYRKQVWLRVHQELLLPRKPLHIVAVIDKRADPARKALAFVKMDINDAFNGVLIDGQYHDRLHTDLYYRSVNAALVGQTTYAGVAARLTAIGIAIDAGAFPF